MSYCNVTYCRFAHTHTTRGHRCGTCGKFGHGQTECGDHAKIANLEQYRNDVLPYSSWCSICKESGDLEAARNHTIASHICKKCDQRHSYSASECIIQSIEHYKSRFSDCYELHDFDIDLFKQHIGHYNSGIPIADRKIYCILNVGMGCQLYVYCHYQNEPLAIFMHSDSWGQYGEATNDEPILKKYIDEAREVDASQFIVSANIQVQAQASAISSNTSFECPICRKKNSINSVSRIYGSSDKCSICLTEPVTKFFHDCGHACTCDGCFMQLIL